MANPVLRQFRESLGLNQREFAEPASLNPVYVCQVETGQYNLGRDAALKILEAYRRELAESRITLEDLLRGESRSAA